MSELTDELTEVYGQVSNLLGVEPELLTSFRLCILKVAALENENVMNAHMVEKLEVLRDELFKRGADMAHGELAGQQRLLDNLWAELTRR